MSPVLLNELLQFCIAGLNTKLCLFQQFLHSCTDRLGFRALKMHSRAYMLLEKEWFKLQRENLPWVSCDACLS